MTTSGKISKNMQFQNKHAGITSLPIPNILKALQVHSDPH